MPPERGRRLRALRLLIIWLLLVVAVVAVETIMAQAAVAEDFVLAPDCLLPLELITQLLLVRAEVAVLRQQMGLLATILCLALLPLLEVDTGRFLLAEMAEQMVALEALVVAGVAFR